MLGHDAPRAFLLAATLVDVIHDALLTVLLVDVLQAKLSIHTTWQRLSFSATTQCGGRLYSVL